MITGPLFLAFCLSGTIIAAAANPPAFFARVDYGGLASSQVEAGDVNNDGITDLVAGETGNIRVLLGNGDGTFRTGPVTNTSMRGAESFILRDVNGDGTPDLVLVGGLQAFGVPQGIGICFGNGDGTFQQPVFYQAGSDTSLFQAVIGDFNGDGIPDIVSAGSTGVWFFSGLGDGTFRDGVETAFLSGDSADVSEADFNRDGKLDLVVTLPRGGFNDLGGGFVVLLGNGDGTFQPPLAFTKPLFAQALVTGDVNGDGYADIVLSIYGGEYVYIYFGNGKGEFSGPHYVALLGATGIAIGDLNGDGIPDLITPWIEVAYGKGDGTFLPQKFYSSEADGYTNNVILADLRHNGRTDIVAESDSAVSVLLSEGKGRYEDGVFTSLPEGAGCGAGDDYNGDGKPDLAVNTSTGVTVLLGTGKAISPYAIGSSMTLPSAGCLVSGDLNGDGIPDLLVPTPTSVVAYLGHGDGTFTISGATSISNGSQIALGDFNHDGKLDFATSGNLMALGNGDGKFQTPTQIFIPDPTSESFSYVAAGDLNNDGWTDLILTDGFENKMYVLINNHLGGFRETLIEPLEGQFSSEPGPVVFADLNGDGNLDAVVASISQDGGGGIYLGNGKGKLTFVSNLLTTISGQNLIAVGDVNGDGVPDLGVLQPNSVGVFVGNGDGTFGAPQNFGVGPAPGFVLLQVLHGQAVSSGVLDIVAPDGSGGVMVLINETK